MSLGFWKMNFKCVWVRKKIMCVLHERCNNYKNSHNTSTQLSVLYISLDAGEWLKSPNDPDHVSLSTRCRLQLVPITSLDALSAPPLTHVIFLLECGQTETGAAGISACLQCKTESEASGRVAEPSSCWMSGHLRLINNWISVIIILGLKIKLRN